MRVLGIDPGLAACGYGMVVATGSRVRPLAFGSWRTAPGERLERRLQILFEGVDELIETHAPEAVVLEESYVGADPRVALSVGQVRGAVLVASARAGVACREYAPAHVKQAVCGYGRADKAQVQGMVRAILALEEPPRPHHAADALAVAICHALAPPLARVAG